MPVEGTVNELALVEVAKMLRYRKLDGARVTCHSRIIRERLRR